MRTNAFIRDCVVTVLLVTTSSGLPAIATAGEDFEPVDGAAGQMQSRRYAVEDSLRLLRASLAVLQDIRYMVTETEVDPGLIVAQGTSPRCYCQQTLTVSVQPAPEGEVGHVLRLTATQPSSPLFWVRAPEEGDLALHGDFFAHLDRELHREAAR